MTDKERVPDPEMDRAVCERLGIQPIGGVVRHVDGELEADSMGPSEPPAVVIWDVDDVEFAIDFAERVRGRHEPAYPAVSTDPSLRHLLEEALLEMGLWPLVWRGTTSKAEEDRDMLYLCAFQVPDCEWDFEATTEGEDIEFRLWACSGTSGGPTPSAAICAAVLELPR